MPCYDGRDEEAQAAENQELKERLDLVTRLLCDLCTSQERGKGHIKYCYEKLHPQGDLFFWWEAHKEADRRRLQREEDEATGRRVKARAEKLVEDLKESGLQKLTLPEQKALGLR